MDRAGEQQQDTKPGDPPKVFSPDRPRPEPQDGKGQTGREGGGGRSADQSGGR